MRRARRFLLPAAFVALGATAHLQAAGEPTADARFEAAARSYVEKLLVMSPELATRLGDHRFDHRLDDYSKEGQAQSRVLAAQTLDGLAAIPARDLSRTNSVDYRILKSRLEYELFRHDELRERDWNPLRYHMANAIYELLVRDFAPLEVRLRNAAARLKQVPNVVRAAKENLKRPPRVFTETAILQNRGAIALVRDELAAQAARAPQVKPVVDEARAVALAALEEYGQWLEKELLPRSDGDFRLGEEKYRRKLAFDLDSDLPMEEILRRAQEDLKKTQRALYDTAVPLHRRYLPDAALPTDEKAVIKAVLDRLAQTRPTNETIVGRADETLRRATQFVRDKGIVTVPDVPVKVIVMPEFDRGVTVAYCRPAPPLEPQGQTFYAIAPTPADWKPERVESYFREYNDYMLEELTIHEAMPGHYLQIAHASRFEAPTMVRKLFMSGPFVEGWALYGEQVMADAGYGGPEVRMQQLKMKARAIVNAILDQKIHTAGMTEEEARRLMMDEGFQEEGEAAGKWRRASLSSAQLSTYYVGLLGVSDIRRDFEAKMKGPVDYRKLHDTMLSFGSPSPKYVREMLGLAR